MVGAYFNDERWEETRDYWSDGADTPQKPKKPFGFSRALEDNNE